MEKYQIHPTEKHIERVCRKALQTFPFQYYHVGVVLLSKGIPYVSPKDTADAIQPYVLACKEKNVAPFVTMGVSESSHVPGYFTISSVGVYDQIRQGTNEFMQELQDTAANAIMSGARPHMICYDFKSPEAYARFMEKLGTDHAHDKIESMAIELPVNLLVNKYFLQDSLEFRIGSSFDKSEREVLHSWMKMLDASIA